MTKYLLKSKVVRLLTTEIIERLGVSHYDTSQQALQVFAPLATAEGLAASYDLNDLSMLHEVTAMFPPYAQVVDRLALSHSAATNKHIVLRALYAHREWLVKNPDLFQHFHHFLCLLSTAFKATDNHQADLIRCSQALSVAMTRISEYGYPETSHLHGTESLNNPTYIALLLHHAENVHELLQYRYDRGLDMTAVMEPHDEEDFNDYLEQHAVREGWL